jgi:hypothetical protein
MHIGLEQCQSLSIWDLDMVKPSCYACAGGAKRSSNPAQMGDNWLFVSGALGGNTSNADRPGSRDLDDAFRHSDRKDRALATGW